ncbi:hypothetical protein [Streptomyces pactum]|nr:hypothetical protein [Streptomyces pactum]
MPYSAPHLFGARRCAFERYLRRLLLATSQCARFSARQPGTGIFVRPSPR